MDALDYFDAAVAREKAARKAKGRTEELSTEEYQLLGRIARMQADSVSK